MVPTKVPSLEEKFGAAPKLRFPTHQIRMVGLSLWLLVTVISCIIATTVVIVARRRALRKLKGDFSEADFEKARGELADGASLYKANEEENKMHLQRKILAVLWVLCSGLIVLTMTGMVMDQPLTPAKVCYWMLLWLLPFTWLSFLTQYHIRGRVLS